MGRREGNGKNMTSLESENELWQKRIKKNNAYTDELIDSTAFLSNEMLSKRFSIGTVGFK